MQSVGLRHGADASWWSRTKPLIADAVAARLRSEGYEVTVARDGPPASIYAERVDPDLVVLDLMLPGLDGLEVCRRIQQRPPRAGADAHRPRRRDRPGRRPGGRRRRLPHQAVQHARAGGAGAGAAAPGRRPRRRGTSARPPPRRRSRSTSTDAGVSASAARSCTSPRPSSTCSSAWSSGPAGSSPASGCSSRCGATATGPGPGPSTPTCGRCAASSATTWSARSTASATRWARPRPTTSPDPSRRRSRIDGHG